MGLHSTLTNMPPCNIKKCCCCCELCSIATCVFFIGIITAISVPYFLGSAMIRTPEWNQEEILDKCDYVPDPAEDKGFNYMGFLDWLSFGIRLSILINFILSYCCK